MLIKDIIQNSTLGLTAYLTRDNVKNFISYLIHNKTIIENFPNMVLAINTDEGEDLEYIKKILGLYLEDTNYIFLEQNRGHMFGTMDLDEAVFAASKQFEGKYLFKVSQDMILNKELLTSPLETEADFYFLPGFSLETVARHSNFENLVKVFGDSSNKDFTPQSNFFILNKSCPTVYGGAEVINEYYEKFQEIIKENPEAKCWEVFPDPKFDCETFLGRTINSNNLTYCNLLNQKDFFSLWTYVASYKIGDPSHKNILLPCGICHYQWSDKPIAKIGYYQ